jgi:glycosyltransferase involved in cell wall biosynthesis
MRVLQLHNRYRQPGGEDVVAKAEAAMLRAYGHDVHVLEVDNDVHPGGGVAGNLRLVAGSTWSSASYRDVSKICREFRPAVAHVHNFWMRLSPAVHAACHSEGVATVQTLHNFRLLCAGATFLRNGSVCEDCLGKIPWRGALRSCYRGSKAASTAVVAMMTYNNLRGTWQKDVDAFIALSDHSRSKFIAAGLPKERIHVKRNFIQDLGSASQPPAASRRILFAGRLSAEKGVDVLLKGWAQARVTDAELLIVGDGPERAALEFQAAALGLQAPSVRFAGAVSPAQVREYIEASRIVVMPSVWYEAAPMMLVESFCAGRGAIVSNLGALAEIVNHRKTGLHFTAGDGAALAGALQEVLSDDTLANDVGRQAREDYLEQYTPAKNYAILQQIYDRAIITYGRSHDTIAYPAKTSSSV